MDGETALVTLGERLSRTIRYTREDIATFARMSFDDNPLHYDLQAAQRARFGEVIAAGQHTSSIMMGLVASHFSRASDGLQREMLCLNFNFSYKLPVFADQEIELAWKVALIETNRKLGGLLVHLDGVAIGPAGRAAVIGRGTILLKEAGSEAGLPLSIPGELLDVAPR